MTVVSIILKKNYIYACIFCTNLSLRFPDFPHELLDIAECFEFSTKSITFLASGGACEHASSSVAVNVRDTELSLSQRSDHG